MAYLFDCSTCKIDVMAKVLVSINLKVMLNTLNTLRIN